MTGLFNLCRRGVIKATYRANNILCFMANLRWADQKNINAELNWTKAIKGLKQGFKY